MKKYYRLFIIAAFFYISICSNAQIINPQYSDSLGINNSDSLEMKIDESGNTFYELKKINYVLAESDTTSAKVSLPKLVKSEVQQINEKAFLVTDMPNDIEVDKTKAVGEINITSNEANGVLSHVIPIDIYPTSGIQPGTSLVYSSQLKENTAGYGWTIGGLSVISTVHSNYYYDGSNYKPATSDKHSALTLNEMRLIKLNENGDASQVNYQTEQGNILVTCHYLPIGIRYFEVKYPNGQKATFGYKENTNQSELSYPITRLEDNLGNFVDYSYILSNNVYYPTEIKYGKNTNIIGTLKFSYENSSSSREMYMAGKALKQKLILKAITTFYQNTLLKTYTLTHETKKTINYLTKLSCRAGSEELNPLKFYYGINRDEYNYFSDNGMVTYAGFKDENGNRIPTQNLVMHRAKFSKKNNKEGFIVYPYRNTFDVIAQYIDGNKINQRYGSRYHPEQVLLINRELVLFSESQQIVAEENFQGLFPADIYGNGTDELIKINYGVKTSTQAFLKLTHYDENLVSRSKELTLNNSIFKEGDRHSAYPRQFLIGDFNGDGKAELVAISGCKTPRGDNASSMLTMVNLESMTELYNSTSFSYDFFNERLLVVDFNGDGKADICHITNSGMFFYSYVDNTFKQITYSWDVTAKELVKNSVTDKYVKELMVGDLNGDGIMDILLSPKRDDYTVTQMTCGCCNQCRTSIANGKAPELSKCLDPMEYIKQYNSTCNTWTILWGTGTSFKKETFEHVKHQNQGKTYWPCDGTYSSKNYNYSQFLLLDVNNDGLSDLLEQRYDNIKDNYTVYLYLNIDGKINAPAEPAQAQINLSKRVNLLSANVGSNFYTTHGTNQILAIEASIGQVYSYSRDENQERMLTGMVNSHGIINKYWYLNLIHSSNSQSTSKTFAYPYYKEYINMNVLTSTSSYLGNELIKSQHYTYKDAVIGKQGLGFKGFAEIIVKDNIRNQQITQTFDPTNFGVLINLDTPTKQESYTYNKNIASNKILKMSLSNKQTKDKLNGYTTNYGYTYDSYNNPLTETIQYGNGSISSKTENKYQNINDNNTYILGLLTEKTESKTRNNQTIKSTLKITHNSSYLPITEDVYYNSNTKPSSSKKYGYTNFNLTSQSVQTYESEWLETKYSYDHLGRTITETDPMGFSTNYSYKADNGLLQYVTDYKNHRTTYEYDIWGRKIKTIYPDGVSEEVNIQWDKLESEKESYDPNKNAGHLVIAEPVTNNNVITASQSITLKSNFSHTASTQGSLLLSINSDLYTQSPSNGIQTSYIITSKTTGQPLTQIYYDALGREIRKGEKRFDGSFLYVDNIYDKYGRLSQTSMPFNSVSASLWNTNEYDKYDRLIATTYPSEKKDTYLYIDGEPTLASNIDGILSTKTYDASGQLTSVKDNGGTITYTYRADGQTATITAPGGVTTSFSYDEYGRQTSINDPSAGIRSYYYDNAGNINKEIDAETRTTNIIYDKYNRIQSKELINVDPYTKKQFVENKTNYTYDKDGLLSSVVDNNKTNTYSYDTYGRIQKTKESIIDGIYLEKEFTYANGNINSIKYTSSKSGVIGTLNYIYQNGHFIENKLNNNTTIWKLTKENTMGIPVEAKTGGLTRYYEYDTFGMPTARRVNNGNVKIQDFGYKIDLNTYNLSWRKDNIRNIQEDFEYDNLNRLVTFGGTKLTYDSQGKGNIVKNSSIGDFTYTSAKPYQVTEINTYNNNIPLRNQEIVYNTLQRPTYISETDHYNASLIYDSDGHRVKMQLKKGNNDILLRYYLGGNYEIESGITGNKEILYLDGDTYSASSVYVKENGAWEIYYLCRDYLGSITHIVSSNGEVKQELSYDAWGNLRNPQTHELYAVDSQPALFLSRGYTGHEHLPWFGLINMNARLYDPVLGRFLSPDPYVQAPYFSQNFNRYSYVLNNPLRYTDPNGEWVQYVIGALVGGIINVAVNWDNINNFTDGLAYFGIGAVAGVLAATGNVYAIIGGGALSSGLNSSLTQYNTQGYVDPSQVGMSATVGAITSGVSFGMAKGLEAPLNSAFSNVGSSLALQKGLSYGTNGALTGFAVGTGIGLANGQDLDDAAISGLRAVPLGFTTGFGGGFYKGYNEALSKGVSPWNGKGEFRFQLQESDGNLKIYEVTYDGKKFLIGGDMEINNKTLTIKNLDIDGKSTNLLGVKGVREFTNSFGKYMNANEVHIIGAQRTTGASPGKISTYKHIVK